ncbi:MAG: glycoside hydrolase family 13 protein [Bacilli bacterium]|nr:glycoside hydrolase family 13 protein [Bacilli bacterium]
MEKNISFKMEKLEDGKYKVMIQADYSCGWIYDLKLNLENSLTSFSIPISHKENKDNICYFESIVEIPQAANYRYYFSYFVDGKRYFIKNNKEDNEHINRFEMFKMSQKFEVPDWAKGKMMYHIFVDRFYKGRDEELKEMPRRVIHKDWNEDMIIGPDSNGIWNADFYGGDLKGITKKLDYIKSLGVSILYLSPIVYSQSNHRYDTSDYEQVDPYLGNWEDLEELCNMAHKKGMKVIVDSVFNHTGNDSKYFNEYHTFDTEGAFDHPNSYYGKYYKKREIDGKTQFEYWWGFKNLPVCNGNSYEWLNYITGVGGVIDLWFSHGIDGLRLDVADLLTDEFIENIRTAVKRNKEDGFIIGEVWKNPMRMNRGYIESGRGMDSVMNYPLVDALIRYYKYEDRDKLRYVIEDTQTEYPDEVILSLMNFTSTHDISRAINIFSSDEEFSPYSEWVWDNIHNDRKYQEKYKLTKEQYEKGKETYKSYLFSLTFLPGILSLFYGDEVGLEGLGNLSNRGTFPWNHIDSDLLKYVQELGKIREKEKFLEKANLRVINISPNYLIFERFLEDEGMHIVVNRTSKEGEILVPEEYKDFDEVYSLNGSREDFITPYGGVALKKNKVLTKRNFF